jgi:EPS-associated MarR family transcriptional regulator
VDKAPISDRDDPTGKNQAVDFELLYLLETEPHLSQREIASRLGISLGKVNYCLRALLESGLVKIERFRQSQTKMDYAYVLTPQGIAKRAALTGRFLKSKLAEYARLKAQIEALQGESPRTQET